jgi:hypothetical protein
LAKFSEFLEKKVEIFLKKSPKSAVEVYKEAGTRKKVQCVSQKTGHFFISCFLGFPKRLFDDLFSVYSSPPLVSFPDVFSKKFRFLGFWESFFYHFLLDLGYFEFLNSAEYHREQLTLKY